MAKMILDQTLVQYLNRRGVRDVTVTDATYSDAVIIHDDGQVEVSVLVERFGLTPDAIFELAQEVKNTHRINHH